MIPASVRARVHTLFAIAFGTLPALAQSSDRDWNQARGNSAGTARTEFAPVRVTPVPVWKQPLGVLACEPVAWAGVVYAIATDAKGARKLHALDVATGLPVAKAATLPAKGALHAAVWQGTVVVTSPEAVVFYSARGDQLAPRERKLTGDFPSAPTIHAGLAYVCGLKPGTTEPTIEVADIAQQKWLQSLGPGAGHAAVIDGKLPGSAELRAAVFQVEPGSKQKQFGFTQSSVSGLGTKSVQFGAWTLEMFTLTDPPAATGPGFEEAYVAYIRPREHESGGAWFVYTPGPFQASDGTKLHTLIAPRALSPIVTPAALVDGRVFGFSASGELIRFDKDGKYVLVVPKSEKLPAGARPGPATVAQDVLYLGNWAVELPAGRVLWCDPSLAATTPLLPLADGRIVYGTAAGELVCAGDPSAKVAAPASRARATPVRRASPTGGDGVVLATGEFVAGAVTRLDAGRVRVTPANGEPREFAPAELALVASEGETQLVGREHAVYFACYSALQQSWFDALEKLFASWRDIGCPAESQRLVSEAQEWGLEAERATAWSQTLTGKTVNGSANAAKQRARVAGEEEASRRRVQAAFLAASDWCAKRALARTASALLVQAEIVLRDQPVVREREAALLPREFPGRDASARATTWSHVARAILPSDGVLVAHDDPAWERARTPPWNEDSFAVRTRNVIVYSRERDPDSLGQCLGDADRTVRVLAGLLPRPAGSPVPGGAPLDVRLHASRAEFLSEADRAGAQMAWAAGYYSPGENVSRFYVPRGETAADPLARNLAHVIVHEVTHHYISARWLGDDAKPAQGDPLRPGFWIVEGFARFVEDQVVEMERRGERFDDDTVASIEAAAAVAEQGGLLPMKRFLQASQMQFAQLPAEGVVAVQLRNTLGKVAVTPKSSFYEQAGSLVFFLVNEAGEERRAKVFEYLRAWYAGEVPKESWKLLGYPTVEALEVEYGEFLARIRAR